MYEMSNDQLQLIKNMIWYCLKKTQGVTSKIGDRAIFIHIIRNCLIESLKFVVSDVTVIGVTPIRINEILITTYGNEIAIITLKNKDGRSYIDLEDENTIKWLV